MPYSLDSILRKTPHWYRTPLVQTIVLGLVFFCVFCAYTTIQFYAASTYGPLLAANSVCAIYASFTFACMFAPAVTNKLGSRRTMFVGILGYAVLVLCSLVYFWSENKDRSSGLVVWGGVVLGCGAALLWTGQGRLLLQYAAVAERGNSNQSGTILGLFWAVFQCSALVGGATSFAYYNTQPTGSTLLYFIFLGFILAGALATQLLLPPSMLHVNMLNSNASNNKDVTTERQSSEKTGLLDTNVAIPLNIEEGSGSVDDVISSDPWFEEARKTISLFFSKPMLLLSVLFFYTGFNQPYQQATFGNRFFTRRMIGIELIVFHLMEIVGAIYCGQALDASDLPSDSASPTRHNKRVALQCLVVFILVNMTGNLLALLQEYRSFDNVQAFDISDARSLWPSLAFACWGFADSQIQVYCYWLIGSLFCSGDEHARAVGFYKCVQSLGVSVGFYLIPTSRMTAMTQLLTSSGIFVLGTGLSILQLHTY